MGNYFVWRFNDNHFDIAVVQATSRLSAIENYLAVHSWNAEERLYVVEAERVGEYTAQIQFMPQVILPL